ncbi:MAG: SLBB domain-containing protein, partial [Myxococcales bacterium]|nr:SLBB domain-containing protein [Myxococcales bacterium]
VTAQATDYKLGPGDTIHLEIHNVDMVSDLLHSSDGHVSVPYVGKVALLGLTAFEAEQKLREVLADGYILRPEVSVAVKEFTSQTVELFGAVKKPGVQALQGASTLRALITQAGGVDLEKSTGFVTVVRSGTDHRIPISDLDGEQGAFQLQGGDVVNVEQGNTIFLAGEVKSPGAVTYNRGLTASQALLMAGGSTEFGRLSGAYIVRGDERIQVNLKKILKGKDADVELKPGDRVVVPVSPI